jgi:fluoride exporter
LAYLLAALGGALGALARWGISVALPGTPGGWPWATLVVNLTGCLLIGLLLVVLSARSPHLQGPQAHGMRTFLGTGVLGGYTTWSAFAVEVVRLVDGGALVLAVGYVLASVLGGVLAVAAGAFAGRAVTGRSGL